MLLAKADQNSANVLQSQSVKAKKQAHLGAVILSLDNGKTHP